MTCPNQGQYPGGRCALEPDHEGPCSFRCAAPGCPGLPYPASLRRHPCVECECHGELVPGVLWPWGVDGEDTAAVVERCDQCGRFEDDDAAAAALASWLEEERGVQTWATTVSPFAATNREDGRAAISYGGRVTDRMTADAIHALADGEPWALCRGGLHVALVHPSESLAVMVAAPTSFGWRVMWSTLWLHRGIAFSRLLDAPNGREVEGLRALAGAIASARSVRDVFRGETVSHRRRQAKGPTAEQWNARHLVGTMVHWWTGPREGEPSGTSPTRSRAETLGGHTPVVWVEGHPACIALTHVEPVR